MLLFIKARVLLARVVVVTLGRLPKLRLLLARVLTVGRLCCWLCKVLVLLPRVTLGRVLAIVYFPRVLMLAAWRDILRP